MWLLICYFVESSRVFHVVFQTLDFQYVLVSEDGEEDNQEIVYIVDPLTLAELSKM